MRMAIDHHGIPDTIDVDIGTLGKPIASSRFLVTFDPFDAPIFNANFERLPFAISPFVEGNASFYANQAVPGCSSLLRPNAAFSLVGNESAFRADCIPENGCHPAKECSLCAPCHTNKHHIDHIFHHIVLSCRRLRNYVRRSVPTLRLSTFLLERRVQRIQFLKIDAQGLDRSIVHDVFTRTNVTVDRLRVECQLLDRAPANYDAMSAELGDRKVSAEVLPNDCYSTLELVRRYRPSMARKVRWEWSNCHMAEYNLDFYQAQ